MHIRGWTSPPREPTRTRATAGSSRSDRPRRGVEDQVDAMSVQREGGGGQSSQGSFLRWIDPDDTEGEGAGGALLSPADPDDVDAQGFKAGLLKPDATAAVGPSNSTTPRGRAAGPGIGLHAYREIEAGTRFLDLDTHPRSRSFRRSEGFRSRPRGSLSRFDSQSPVEQPVESLDGLLVPLRDASRPIFIPIDLNSPSRASMGCSCLFAMRAVPSSSRSI